MEGNEAKWDSEVSRVGTGRCEMVKWIMMYSYLWH